MHFNPVVGTCPVTLLWLHSDRFLYTGYLIRTSNDDHAGKGATVAEVIYNNENDNNEVAIALGLSKVYDLGYRNHRMDNISIQELRGRLIFLFRMLKVDSIIKTTGQTGVEMEALTAAAIAALTIYDMCKSYDREMVISDLYLLEKSGGKSGSYTRKNNA